MGIGLEKFTKDYYQALKDISSVLPASQSIPAFLTKTSFVIGCSDKAGSFAIQLFSHDNYAEIVMNDKIIKSDLEKEPRFIIVPNETSLDQVLFPQDDKGKKISITINERHVVLDGLAFSNKEYNDKYWSDAKFYRNCAGSIPFIVTSSGTMLGLDLLWGAELGGQRQERLFEFVKLFGSEVLPTEEQEIHDEAFSDIVKIIPKLPGKCDWSFSSFLASLEGPVESNVLLLGSYESDEDFLQIKAALEPLGYNGFLLKESPDIPIQSNLEKLFSAIICSCFIIVVDKKASGHIAELSNMLQYNFRPVIVLRDSQRPATAFLEDTLLTNEHFQVAVVTDITTQSLLPHIKWAREMVERQIVNFNGINRWRKI